jgi:prepilin signal peptidase PulO-like enzyme (type II secretory pathway)
MIPSFEAWLAVLALGLGLAAMSVLGPARLLADLDIPKPSWPWRIGLGLSVFCAVIAANLIVPPTALAFSMALSLTAGACAAIAFYDASFLIIPNMFSVAVVIAALLFWWAGLILPSVAGAGLCAGLLAVVAWAWKKSRGGDGLGQGDIKLAGALGMILGVQGGLWLIIGAASSGALWGLAMMRLRLDAQPPLIPFGLFLSVCGLGLVLVQTR